MKKLKILFLIISFLFATAASAQTVLKVKGKAALIDTGETPLEVGSEYITVNDVGRKTGLIRIKQVRGNKAVADIEKGIVVVGETLTPRPPPKSRFQDEPAEDDADIRRQPKTQSAAGLIVGYSMDSISFTAGSNQSPPALTQAIAMSGNSYKIKGFYDYPWTDTFTWRFTGGLDGFNATSSGVSPLITSNSSTTASLSATYIALEGSIMWNFYRGKGLTKVYGELGYSFQYNSSTSSNVYSLVAPSYANALFVGGGSNITMSKDTFIPVFLHYDYYLAGSGITQNSINFAAGYGWML